MRHPHMNIIKNQHNKPTINAIIPINISKTNHSPLFVYSRPAHASLLCNLNESLRVFNKESLVHITPHKRNDSTLPFLVLFSDPYLLLSIIVPFLLMNI